MNKIQEKGWSKERLHRLLDLSDAAVIKAAMVLYHRQTDDEKAVGDTKHHNKVGFSAAHAEGMTRFCEFVRANKNITPAFMAFARRSVKHYHRQLLEVANEKMPEGPKNPKLLEVAS